jgi:Short-chain dehydrogenases of various substrate specificities
MQRSPRRGRQGPIDILINNAGYELACPVDSLSDEALTRQFDTNVLGSSV